MNEKQWMLEASYQDSPTLKKIEKLFGNIQDSVMKFYEGMKARKMDPNSVQQIYDYYFSTAPDTDGTRFTQYNSDLKEIENLVKEMFHFRSVQIGLLLISYHGSTTNVYSKTIMTVPVIRGEQKKIVDFIDVGSVVKGEDGKVRYKIGYPTTLKADKKGITDTNNAITVSIKLELYKDLTPKHYVAVLLHEIGHNLDYETININVKNDSQFIHALHTYEKESSLGDEPIPKFKMLWKLIRERDFKNKEHYTDAMKKIAADMGNSIGFGGTNKRSEMFADALPTAYGYGPALIEALQAMSPDTLSEDDDIKNSKSLFQAYKNYLKLFEIAADLDSRESNVHGSNIYRAKMTIAQLQRDLNNTKDSKLKKRMKENIKDLEKIIEDILNEKRNSDEVQELIRTWVNHIDVEEPDSTEKNESIILEDSADGLENVINDAFAELKDIRKKVIANIEKFIDNTDELKQYIRSKNNIIAIMHRVLVNDTLPSIPKNEYFNEFRKLARQLDNYMASFPNDTAVIDNKIDSLKSECEELIKKLDVDYMDQAKMIEIQKEFDAIVNEEKRQCDKMAELEERIFRTYDAFLREACDPKNKESGKDGGIPKEKLDELDKIVKKEKESVHKFKNTYKIALGSLVAVGLTAGGILVYKKLKKRKAKKKMQSEESTKESTEESTDETKEEIDE